MAQLVAVSISEPLLGDMFERLLGYMAPQKQAKIRRYYHAADAQRSLIAELLTRTLACWELSLRNDQLEFQVNDWGKPSIAGAEHYHYNISHADDWVVCANDAEPVGVDVEHIAPIDVALAERFFSPEEANYVLQLPTSQQLDCFYDFWTLKESYIKAQGKGLSIPLDLFSIGISESGDISLTTSLVHKRCYFKQYPIDANYKLSLCMHQNAFPSKVKVLTLQELVRQFQLCL